MKRNRIIELPGGVVVFGASKQILKKKKAGEVPYAEVTDFDFFVYDHATKKLTEVFQGNSRILVEEFSFDPSVSACIEFSVASDLDHLAVVDAVVESAIKELSVDKADVGIVVSELVHNAFQIAEERSKKKNIYITLIHVPPKILLIGITDELGRLNLDMLPDSFDDEEGHASMLEHGRGILITSELMEWLAYNPSNDGFKEMLIKVPLNGVKENKK